MSILRFVDLVAPEPFSDQSFSEIVSEAVAERDSDGSSVQLQANLAGEPFLDCVAAIKGTAAKIERGALLFAAGLQNEGRLNIFAGLLTLATFAHEVAEALGYASPESPATPEPEVRFVTPKDLADLADFVVGLSDDDDDEDDDDDDESVEPEPFADLAGGVVLKKVPGGTSLSINLILPGLDVIDREVA